MTEQDNSASIPPGYLSSADWNASDQSASRRLRTRRGSRQGSDAIANENDSPQVAPGIFWQPPTSVVAEASTWRTGLEQLQYEDRLAREAEALSMWGNPARPDGHFNRPGLWEQMRQSNRPRYTHDHWRFTVYPKAGIDGRTLLGSIEAIPDCSEVAVYVLYPSQEMVVRGVALCLASVIEAIPGVSRVTIDPAIRLEADLPGVDGQEFIINNLNSAIEDLWVQHRRTDIPLLREDIAPRVDNPLLTYHIPYQGTSSPNIVLHTIRQSHDLVQAALYAQLVSELSSEMRDRMGIIPESDH